MGNYTIRWYNDEQTIIVIDILNTWNWQDAYESIKQQVAMSETVEHRVHAIFHFHNVPTIPRGSGLSHIVNLMRTRAINEGLDVFVGTHKLLQMLINAISNVYDVNEFTSKYYFVATLDEALTIITNHETKNA